MRSNINLLAPSQKEATREGRMIRYLKLVSIISVCFSGISSIGIFILLSQLSPSSIIKQEVKVLASIAAVKQKEDKLILVSKRVQDIQSIIDKRQDYKKLTEDILSNVPENVDVGNLRMSAGVISLTAGSTRVSSINKFIDNFIGLAMEKKIIKNLTIDGVALDPKTGSYNLSISANRI